MKNDSANPQLVEKLAKILEQAQSGELTSFAAVTFKKNGGVDQWSYLTRIEDGNRLSSELEALKQI